MTLKLNGFHTDLLLAAGVIYEMVLFSVVSVSLSIWGWGFLCVPPFPQPWPPHQMGTQALTPLPDLFKLGNTPSWPDLFKIVHLRTSLVASGQLAFD